MNNVIDFIHTLRFEDLPTDVIEQAQLCVLDLLGVAAAGHATRLAGIMQRFVSSQYPGERPLLFSRTRASASGSALFGAMLIDSLDAHDGQVLTKGHVGVAILPGLLALAEETQLSGKDFITALVLGYEIATRAGSALHETVTDYHTSGAWNGLGVAAIGARLQGLTPQQSWEALGTAEFYGPRSQMMRCIDHPTMIKDGSGWGALAGVSATLLAKAGFTGAPAVTVAATEVSSIWSDLGRRWYILEQYFKAYPVCRWAQPAVEAVRQLRADHNPDITQIRAIHIHSFHEATRLHTCQPTTTEQAQYSLPFSVACAMIDGHISAAAVAETDQGIHNPCRKALSAKVIIHEDAAYNAHFPAQRWAHAVLEMHDGSRYPSAPTIARGNPENPLSRTELVEKFNNLTGDCLPSGVRDAIRKNCLSLAKLPPAGLQAFFTLLATPALVKTDSA